MRAVVLPGTDVMTTEVGLGCADLFRLPSSRQRRDLLAAAYDAGIRHFDVAPMYGLGWAEKELGRFARHRPDLVVATKFGIEPTRLARTVGRGQGSIRRLLRLFPALQRTARQSGAGPNSGSAGSVLYDASGYDGVNARRSLAASLRQLGADHVDLFLLHDPAPGSVRSDEVREFCEQAHRAGTVRAWGVAGEPAASREVVAALGPGALLQTRGDVLAGPSTTPPADTQATVVFGLLTEGLRRVERFVAVSPAHRGYWTSTTGVDPADRRAIATLLLCEALRSGPQSVLLVGTTRAEHIADVVDAAVRARSASSLPPLREILSGPRSDRLGTLK